MGEIDKKYEMRKKKKVIERHDSICYFIGIFPQTFTLWQDRTKCLTIQLKNE